MTNLLEAGLLGNVDLLTYGNFLQIMEIHNEI